MGNAVKFTAISFAIAFIIGIVSMFFTHSSDVSAIIVLGIFLLIMYYSISTRCSMCGNFAAIHVSNTKFVGKNQSQNHFTRQEQVGASVRRNYRGDIIDETAHYMDVDYIQTTTTNTYENTMVCKYCGNISKHEYQKQSSESHRV